MLCIAQQCLSSFPSKNNVFLATCALIDSRDTFLTLVLQSIRNAQPTRPLWWCVRNGRFAYSQIQKERRIRFTQSEHRHHYWYWCTLTILCTKLLIICVGRETPNCFSFMQEKGDAIYRHHDSLIASSTLQWYGERRVVSYKIASGHIWWFPIR